METHKLKIGGIKYTVRVVGEDETISDRMVTCYYDHIYNPSDRQRLIETGDWKRLDFSPTHAVGEKVSDHPNRIYLEIMSPFYLQ